MSRQTPIWQYQTPSEEGKKGGQPLPKPVPPQMTRPQQPLLQQQYYNAPFDSASQDPRSHPTLPGGGTAGTAPASTVPGGGTPSQPNAAPNPPMRAPYSVPMHGYVLGPGEMVNNNYGNFQMHADQWDQFAIGVRHPSGSGASNAPLINMPMGASDKKPRTHAHALGLLSSDSQDEAAKDGDFEGDTAPSGSLGKVAKRLRMGCLTCRQRKKRCCEMRPKCTECLRLRLTCTWPKPGTEHKNKPKEVKSEENTIEHDIYGKIKVLRGIVEYRSDQ